MTTTPTGQDVSAAARDAANAAGNAMKSAQGATKDAIDGFTDSLKDVRDQASGLVEKVRPQINAMCGYAKDEPVKAMLIAAASGAALMAIVSLCNPATRRSLRSRASEWRDAASETASDAADRASRAADRASRAAESTLESTRQAAKSAVDGVSETMQSLREQAQPLVDRLRPQMEAVSGYAKEDPTRALLIAATAGAALIGLISAFGRSDTDD